MPAFNFDESINPISSYKLEADMSDDYMPDDDDFEEFELPEEVDAVMADEPICNEQTNSAIELYWAPDPFCKRAGQMKRAYDVPLVSHWYRERCPQGYPVKVRVSYQKLLK